MPPIDLAEGKRRAAAFRSALHAKSDSWPWLKRVWNEWMLNNAEELTQMLQDAQAEVEHLRRRVKALVVDAPNIDFSEHNLPDPAGFPHPEVHLPLQRFKEFWHNYSLLTELSAKALGIPVKDVNGWTLREAAFKREQEIAEVERLRALCNHAANALDTLPPNVLGDAECGDTHWFIRDELVSNLRQEALTEGDEDGD